VASENPKIGIWALQGDVELHRQAMAARGITPVMVKMPKDLRRLKGLIIPGGESTTYLKLAEPIGMLDAVKDFVKDGGGIFATCAGAILLANKVTSPEQESLKLINITIERNSYGRQIDSREARGKIYPPLGTHTIPMTFIRAPRILETGPEVKTLARYQGQPVLVQQGKLLVGTFHPELHDDPTVYDYWLSLL
jgi:5'-phosphate synthase pdxT subunit